MAGVALLRNVVSPRSVVSGQLEFCVSPAKDYILHQRLVRHINGDLAKCIILECFRLANLKRLLEL